MRAAGFMGTSVHAIQPGIQFLDLYIHEVHRQPGLAPHGLFSRRMKLASGVSSLVSLAVTFSVACHFWSMRSSKSSKPSSISLKSRANYAGEGNGD
jgi:hypothetical protein